MDLKIVTKVPKINILGKYEPEELFNFAERVVFIDNKEVPKNLSRIILLGLDVAMEQYCDLIEQMLYRGELNEKKRND